MRVRPAAVVAVVAAAGLAVGLTVAVNGLGDEAPGPAAVPPAVGSSVVPEPTASPREAATPASGSAPEVGRTPAGLDALATPSSESGPARVAVPAIDLDLPVRPVGVREDGQMELPANPSQLGWYRFGSSPAPPEQGAAVVAGHLDSVRFGVGPLVRLRNAEVGDEVLVEARDGSTVRYVVSSIDRFDRQALPAELFARSGPPRLHLITCGGAYDPEAGGYQLNLVVTAVPAS